MAWWKLLLDTGHGVCLRFYLKLKQNFLQAIIISSVFFALFHNVYSNAQVYLKHYTIVEIIENEDTPVKYPPINVCPFPSYDPLKLIRLGVNTTVNSAEELEYNIRNLVGINRSLSGEEFVEKAAWKLEDLVQEVNIGELPFEFYYERKTYLKLWHRSFTPLGPCWTFTAPPTVSRQSKELIIKLVPVQQSLQPCHLDDEENKTFSGGHGLCNNSVWADYVEDELLFNFVLLTSVYSSYNIFEVKRERNAEYGSYRFDLFPYKLDSDLPNRIDYDPTECLHMSFLKVIQNQAKCNPVYKHSLTKKIELLCVTFYQQLTGFDLFMQTSDSELLGLEDDCPGQQKEFRWKLAEVKPNKIDYQVNLRMTSNITKTFYRRILYPLGKFLEDMGGSLGLFLGVSFLDLFTLTRLMISVICKGNVILCKYSYLSHVKDLLIFSGSIAIAIPFCLHFQIVFERYRSSTAISSVSLDENMFVDSLSFQKNLTLNDSLLAFASSRSLACQLVSHRGHKCLFKCLLNDLSFVPVSSLYVDDLPICSNQSISLPKVKYVIEKDLILSSLTKSKVSTCSQACKLSNLSFDSDIKFSIHSGPSVSLTDFICGVGGIIGLYFGFSLLGVSALIREKSISRINTTRLTRAIFFSFKMIIILLCVLLCISTLEKYLWSHPIYTITSRKSIEVKQLPAMSLCLWPPFNLKKVVTSGALFHNGDLNLVDPSQKYNIASTIIERMNILEGMYDQRSLWFFNSWTIKDLHFITYTAEETLDFSLASYNRDTKSILNLCQTVLFKEYKFLKPYVIKGRVEWTPGLHGRLGMTMMNVFFHHEDDFPPLYFDIHKAPPDQKIKFKRISSWKGHTKRIAFSAQCASNCIDDSLIKLYKCLLPWMETRPDAQFCNVTQYTNFLLSTWHTNPINSSFLTTFLGEDGASLCKQRCGYDNYNYYVAEYNGDTLVGNGFALDLMPQQEYDIYHSVHFDFSFDARSFEESEDIDGYPTAQFLSESGGIIGMTLGISLLSLLLQIAQKIKDLEFHKRMAT